MKKSVYYPNEMCPVCGDDLCVVTENVEDAENQVYWDGDAIVCSSPGCTARMWMSVDESFASMNWEEVEDADSK